jgi:hypothetical protein
MRTLLVVAVVTAASISSAKAQQQSSCATPPHGLFGVLTGIPTPFLSPEGRAQENYRHAACEYRNCILANPNNQNACEGLRHIMDTAAQTVGR